MYIYQYIDIVLSANKEKNKKKGLIEIRYYFILPQFGRNIYAILFLLPLCYVPDKYFITFV